MAKNGDIIDVMFGWMISLFGWILKTIFKIIWWLISAIFGAIFGKKKQGQDSDSTNNNDVHQYSYNDCVKDLETATQEYTGEELKSRYGYLFVNLLVNQNMTVDQKCQLLVKTDEKTRSLFSNNPLEIGTFYITYIEAAFKIVDQMYGSQSMIVTDEINKFDNDVKTGNLKPMTQYIGSIMSYVGMLGSSNGKFSLDYRIFDKYQMPKWGI